MIEHPRAAIADDLGRAHRAVDHGVLRCEERRHSEEEHYEVQGERPEGHRLQTAVRDLEVLHGLGFRLLCELLALVGREVRHRRAALQIAVGAREGRDDRERPDADADGGAQDVHEHDR